MTFTLPLDFASKDTTAVPKLIHSKFIKMIFANSLNLILF